MTIALTTEALPYPGVHNIRSLGGYRTETGQVTRDDGSDCDHAQNPGKKLPIKLS